MTKQEEAKNILKKYNQEHVLKFYEELDDVQKELLINQILNINFENIQNLYNKTKEEIQIKKDNITPLQYTDKYKLPKEKIKYYEKIGEESIKKGEFAIVTMAGGQGTRLGHNAPKGTYVLDLKQPKSLFEILCDSLKKVNEKYNIVLNWYIMTSKENNEDTIKFFEQNNYLGYPKENISFFIQGELPMIDSEGKVLLSSKYEIKEAADGNGGTFESMRKNGIIDDIEKKEIKWIFIGSIDNILLKVADPLLLGLTIDNKSLTASKSVVKNNPKERVGVFCKRNGKPSVIEYSELPEEMSELVDEKGELVYGESHIMCNLFNIEAIKKISQYKLEYHHAFKKSSYINEKGDLVTSEIPNAYKFESFIFDGFSLFDDITILRAKRQEEFAPIKNAQGIDSPKTAKELYNNYYNSNN